MGEPIVNESVNLEKQRNTYKFSGWRREHYLECIAGGMRRYQAADAVGVHASTVWKAEKAEPEFAKAIAEAEKKACEQVENALFKSATEGNIAAAKFWLTNRSGDRWQDKRAVHVTNRAEAPANYDEQKAELEKLIDKQPGDE